MRIDPQSKLIVVGGVLLTVGCLLVWLAKQVSSTDTDISVLLFIVGLITGIKGLVLYWRGLWWDSDEH